MKIAITGSFGSGKTFLAKCISQNSIPIIYADKLGKEILDNNKKEIFNLLNIELNDNYLNTLKEAIMNNENKFIKYNKWMYRSLPDKIIKQCEQYDNVICDAALIYEWDIAEYFDYIILVKGGTFVQRLQRIANRKPNIKLYTILDKYQISDIEKQKYAHIIINNNGSKEVLKQYAKKIKECFFDI